MTGVIRSYMTGPEIIIVVLVIWNAVVMGLYAFDKNRAVRKGWRIPEKTLLTAALVGGAAGAMLGMYVFRHKTKHAKFRFIVPAALVIQAVLLYALFT